MLLTFASGSFPQDYIPTVCDGYFAKLQIDGNMVSFDLWDTAGQVECVFPGHKAYPK
jgi:Ras-related C3 botulinum toxin substrate 1